jgi:hypothetical protein
MADDVLYEGRERARDLAWERGRWASWVGDSLLNLSIGYGYSYRNALYCLIFLMAVGLLVLRLTHQRVVPSKEGNPIVLGPLYVLDTLVPFVDLRKFLLAGLAGLTK